jgi:hypothetical protein
MARVGRTLLSDAFDVDFDFDLDREGHGFSRAAKHSVLKGRGFQPRRKILPCPTPLTLILLLTRTGKGAA